MKILTCIVICFFSAASFGQTKLISHRSHSGNDRNFRTAVERNLFDITHSNFGLVIKYADKIDTVILTSGNKIIVLRKRYRIIQGKINKVTFEKDTLTKANAAKVFKANNLDSLKTEIQKIYKKPKLDSTLFIGFNKKFKSKK